MAESLSRGLGHHWFAAVIAWSFYSAHTDGGAYAGLFAAAVALGLGAGTLAILGLLAWLGARSSLYVVTERRLVIKSGIAVPIFINLPFSRITAANVRIFGDGTGDVSVTIVEGQQVSYIALWPARPSDSPTRADLALCAASTDGRGDSRPRACRRRRTAVRYGENDATDVATETTELPATA